MIDLLKKGLAAALALFILVLLLYLAFYLFLVVVFVAAGFVLYAKWKGVEWRKLWSQDRSSAWPGKPGKPSGPTPEQTPPNVIDVEYEEIIIERKNEQ